MLPDLGTPREMRSLAWALYAGTSPLRSQALLPLSAQANTASGRSITSLIPRQGAWPCLRHRALLATLASRRSAGPRATKATAETFATDEGSSSGGRIVETELRLEAERSYLSYAMSVIVGRALPDVRDGLKPVQRRILYAMGELGMVPTKPYRKCARVVGEVLGKYHPHGDSSVYEALVRMAQPFSLRAPLVSGHGNFGSVDDDPPAAMRYTECRLDPLSSASLLADLDADTVDYAQNFDASQEEPTVLPSRLPTLLLNGASGIAVGIATKIPPHNMREVVAGLKALIADPDITPRQLMRHIPAPDFPTGAQVMVNDGIREAYETGRGTITMRAKVHIEDGGTSSRGGKSKGPSKQLIVITELPYQAYKAALVENIARLVEEGVIPGVSDVRDESDRTGMRMVVEVKRGSSAQLVENSLYRHTQLQSRFSANMVALVNGTPRSLDLKQFLQHFLDFRCDVVSRRGRHELGKAQSRLHLVQGFLQAMEHLDDVIATIRKAGDSAAASAALQQQFSMSPEQATGVLAMSLGRLTGLEEGKLRDEQRALQARVEELDSLLASREQILAVVAKEADELARKYGDARRSELVQDEGGEIRDVDTIPNAPCIITFSRKGYIKRMPAETFALQNRGGRGKAGARLKGGDVMDVMLSVSSHDSVLVFTEDGLARSLPAYQIPEASRTASGTPITQILPIQPGMRVKAMMALSEFPPDHFLLMLTEKGLIKKTSLSQFQTIRSTGLIAIKLRPGDRLLGVDRCTSGCQVLVASSCGKAIRFSLDDANLRPLARTATGVVAIRLKSKQSRLVGMSVISPNLAADLDSRSSIQQQAAAAAAAAIAEDDGGPWALLVTARGLGKRVSVSGFRSQARGGAGVLAIKLNEGDELASMSMVESGSAEEVLLATSGGVLVRTSLSSVSVYSRTAKGLRLVKLGEGDELQTLALVPPEEEEEEE